MVLKLKGKQNKVLLKFQFKKLIFCFTFSLSNFESGYEAENKAGCDGQKGISDHNEFSVQPRNTLRQRNQFEETRLSDDEIATARFPRSGKFINFSISSKSTKGIFRLV
jgi:hypothetical protein